MRKSVANHLNDITKDHPGIVLDLVAGWDRREARTAWIVRHALRTLVKKATPAPSTCSESAPRPVSRPPSPPGPPASAWAIP